MFQLLDEVIFFLTCFVFSFILNLLIYKIYIYMYFLHASTEIIGCPYDVITGILGGGDEQHKNQRYDSGEPGQRGDLGNHLDDTHVHGQCKIQEHTLNIHTFDHTRQTG